MSEVDKTPPVMIEEETADIMLDLAWHRWEESNNDKRDLDSKASIILAADGIVLAILADSVVSVDMSQGGPYLFASIWAIILLTTSAAFSAIVLINRSYKVFDLEQMKATLCSSFSSKAKLQDKVYDRIAFITSNTTDNLDRMGIWYDISAFALFLGVALAAVIVLIGLA